MEGEKWKEQSNGGKIPKATGIPTPGIEKREHETAYYMTEYKHATSVQHNRIFISEPQ